MGLPRIEVRGDIFWVRLGSRGAILNWGVAFVGGTDEFIIGEYKRIQAIDKESEDYVKESEWLKEIESFAQQFGISLLKKESEDSKDKDSDTKPETYKEVK